MELFGLVNVTVCYLCSTASSAAHRGINVVFINLNNFEINLLSPWIIQKRLNLLDFDTS